MGTLTIRNVDDTTHARLRERAARHGRSVEAEVRGILSEAVDSPRHNILIALHDRMIDDGVEIELPRRVDAPREANLP